VSERGRKLISRDHNNARNEKLETPQACGMRSDSGASVNEPANTAPRGRAGARKRICERIIKHISRTQKPGAEMIYPSRD